MPLALAHRVRGRWIDPNTELCLSPFILSSWNTKNVIPGLCLQCCPYFHSSLANPGLRVWRGALPSSVQITAPPQYNDRSQRLLLGQSSTSFGWAVPTQTIEYEWRMLWIFGTVSAKRVQGDVIKGPVQVSTT